jgi:polyisoprenoid-binding protein YceI
MKKSFVFAAAFCSVVSIGLMVNAAYQLNTPASAVSANIHGPSGLNITAKNNSLQIDDSGDTVKINVAADKFDTGISLRDKHTREAIEADKYPNITLSIPDSAIHVPTDSNIVVTDTVKGNLTFHGVVKEVSVNYKLKNDCQGHLSLDADFVFDMRDFGIKPPSYLGIGVKPDVQVRTSLFINTDDKC